MSDVQEKDISEVTVKPSVDDVPLVTNPPDLTPDPLPEPEPTKISDGVCPLLVEEAALNVRITETLEDGSKITHREPFVALDRPAECPSCGKLFEIHSLPVDLDGERDCVVARKLKGQPKYKAFFDALGVSTKAAATEAAKFGKEGAKLLHVFGNKK